MEDKRVIIDGLTKFLLFFMLLALISIGDNLANQNNYEPQSQNVTDVQVDAKQEMIQIAPNVIGIVDDGFISGIKQLLIFEYNAETKEFEYVSSLLYEDYLNNPMSHRVPTAEDKQ